MSIEIRHERTEDREEIFQVHRDAFQRDDEAELVEKLRQNLLYDHQLSFVALIDGHIVGHLLFTPLKINYSKSSRSMASLALAPLSIRTKFQRRGIGSQLIEFALSQLRSSKVSSTIIVLGHEDYYPKFAFRPAKLFHVRAPMKLSNENCFMLLELIPGTLPVDDDDQGIAQYLPEFGLEN